MYEIIINKVKSNCAECKNHYKQGDEIFKLRVQDVDIENLMVSLIDHTKPENVETYSVNNVVSEIPTIKLL